MSRVTIRFNCISPKEKGFIYVNVLLDLMVIAILMPLIIVFYLYAASYLGDLDAERLEWRLFTSELQGYLTANGSTQIINGGTGLRIEQNGLEYDIEVNGAVIRKQKFNQGHEVMMTGIIKCDFVVKGSILIVTAILSNGTEERAEYAITGS